MVSYGEICDKIKQMDDCVKNAYMHDIHDFVVTETVTNKGRYKLTISLDAGQMLFNPESIPSQGSDCKLRPFLLLLEMDWDKIKKSV